MHFYPRNPFHSLLNCPLPHWVGIFGIFASSYTICAICKIQHSMSDRLYRCSWRGSAERSISTSIQGGSGTAVPMSQWHCIHSPWKTERDWNNFIHIRPFTEWLVRAHPVHSDFRLSEPVDCYVDNLKNGVILSYINDEIKIVAIQKSVLYNDGNLVIILSTFFFSRKWQEKKIKPFL